MGGKKENRKFINIFLNIFQIKKNETPKNIRFKKIPSLVRSLKTNVKGNKARIYPGNILVS
jgi:hypothetical protein